MAKAKKAVKKVVKKGMLHQQVDNKLSLVLIVFALVVFALAAITMWK